jgi:hypothetical protein
VITGDGVAPLAGEDEGDGDLGDGVVGDGAFGDGVHVKTLG